MVSRIPIFIIYSIFTCCCDKGREYAEGEEFKETVLSFDYIQNAIEERNHFQNYEIGEEEVAFDAGLQEVRQRRITIANEQAMMQSMATSKVEQFRFGIRKTITEAMSMSMVDACCSICTMPFEAPCEISQLACHQKHVLHTECLDDWLAHNQKTYTTPKCPMCRSNIDKDQVIKKRMEPPVVKSATPSDPFNGMAKIDDASNDYDYAPPQGMPMVMAPNQQQQQFD